MKKIVSLMMILMFSVTILIGCTDNSTSTTTPTIPDSTTETKDPIKEEFTTYFDHMVEVKYLEGNSSVLDLDGTSINFDDVLKRQIEVFSSDLLYRLFAVYGVGAATDQQGGSKYTLTYNDGTVYSLNGNNATIQNDHIIQTPSTYYGSDPVYEYTDGTEVWYSNSYARNNPDVLETASYAYSINAGKWNPSDLITEALLLENSIQGGYSLNEYNNFNTDSFLRADYSWKWSYDGLGITPSTEAIPAYSSYYSAYYDTLKTAVANLLATGSASGYSFTTAVSSIDHNGFTTTDITNITNYVKDEIIGNDLISYDDNLLSNIETALGGTILTSSNASNLTTSDRYYKAYSLLVPQLVKQALNNVFENTSTNLYELQTTKRTEEETETVTYSALSNKNFTEITIIPKDDTPLTKLVLKFSGIDIDELTVTYTVNSSSTNTLFSNQALDVSNDEEIVIDLSGYYDSYVFDSTGAITFMIVNGGDSTFDISFIGYYDKV